MAWYRITVQWTYNTTANATTALTNINNTLASSGRAERATRNGNLVDLEIDNLTEAEASTLNNSLTSAWNVGTRSTGKASVVRRDEWSQ